jgi:hypothetical protein
VAAHLLETNPKVGLDIFHQMPKMNITVRVGKRACNHYFSFFRHIDSIPSENFRIFYHICADYTAIVPIYAEKCRQLFAKLKIIDIFFVSVIE